MSDPVIKIILAITDLHRAHAIIKQIINIRIRDYESLYALNAAFLSAYRRPFTTSCGKEPTLKLNTIGFDLSPREREGHAILMMSPKENPDINTEQAKRPSARPWQLLGGAEPELVETIVAKLRIGVARALYPECAENPKFWDLMSGPHDLEIWHHLKKANNG